MVADSSPRVARVAPLVRQELMELIIAEVRDPRVGFVTVTDVKMTPDLKAADVWVSVMGAEDQVARSLAGLAAAAPYLRRALGSRLALRVVPSLTFHHDAGLAHAERIDALLAAKGAKEPPAPPPLPTPEVHRAAAPAATPPPPSRRPSGRRRRRR